MVGDVADRPTVCQQVDRSQLRSGLSDQASNVVRGGDVARNADRLSAEGLNLFDHRVGFGGTRGVANRDVGPFSSQP